ncbi:hypothetical protein QFC21_001556 [Naganishia friedmannii]|uniref:Uncharacterized protein n=1 Tax=Naganishia friedmannii TaxID=89922 RepID=A0ACC2W5N2_9TREE|nr:hypothetical protein QFC21_001556 [Naganishia friedmannii]
MHSTPPSESTSLDPPGEDSAFVFPEARENTPYQRPPPTAAAVAAEMEKDEETEEESDKKKHHHRLSVHRMHRPHLHIPSSSRKEQQRTTGAGASPTALQALYTPPSARNPGSNVNDNGDGRIGGGGGNKGGTFLTVPKTYSPHARSLDSQSHTPTTAPSTNTNGNEQRQEEQEDVHSTSSPTSYSASGGGELSDTTTTTSTINAVVKDGSEDRWSRVYSVPTISGPAPASVVPFHDPVKQAIGEEIDDVGRTTSKQLGADQPGNWDEAVIGGKGKKASSIVVASLSVWDQIRAERDTKPGIEPSAIHTRLSHLVTATRAHTLKLSTLQRTIEHRIAEWQVLGDRMDEIARAAEVVGRELVGSGEWDERRRGKVARAGGIGDREEDSPPPRESVAPRGTSTTNPLATLQHLTHRTTLAHESLQTLSSTIAQRETDLQRYREKVQGDAVELEGRMVGSLGRKMRGIEDAQREARRRDLIINIITFTVLLITGIFLSRMVVKISTCDSCRRGLAHLGGLLRSVVWGGR